MPDVFAAFDAHVREREREYVDELSALVRLPTVSAQRSAIAETAAADDHRVAARRHRGPHRIAHSLDYTNAKRPARLQRGAEVALT